MANALFPKAKQGFMDGKINALTGVFKVALVSGYTYDATDEFMSDVVAGGGTVAATSAALTALAYALGVFNADPITWAAVAAGAACSCYITYQASAPAGGADVANTAQHVVLFTDTVSAGALPITPNGSDILITWDTGANKIFVI